MAQFVGSLAFWGRVACVTCCLMLLAGCGGETPRSSVTGHLKIDGKPVPQGMKVVFTPQGSDQTPCVGVTNDQGRYVMYYKPGMKGILEGTYAVSIALPGDDMPEPVMLPPTLAGIKIPKEYRTGSSTLTCTVPRRDTVFDIDITTR